MKKHLWWLVLLVSPGLMAQSGTNSKNARKETAVGVSAKEFDEMRHALAAQQEELANLQQELKAKDQAIQQAEQTAMDAQQKVTSLTKAMAEQESQNHTVAALQADVSQMKTTTANVALGLQ